MFSYAQFARDAKDRLAGLIGIYSGVSQTAGNGYGRHFEFVPNEELAGVSYFSRIKRNIQSLFAHTPNYSACRC